MQTINRNPTAEALGAPQPQSGASPYTQMVANALASQKPQEQDPMGGMGGMDPSTFMKKTPTTTPTTGAPAANAPTGMSNWAGSATPFVYAYLIGKSKMMEHDRLEKDPDDPLGNFSMAMVMPSGNQIKEDPKGMGIPTALGLPFLTPFTASDEAKKKKPEWAGPWESIGL